MATTIRYYRIIVRVENRRDSAATPSAQVRLDAEALGREVREARRRLGLDQRQLAFTANVSPRTVFAIERGKPTIRFDMLVRVLTAVGMRLTTEHRDRAWRPE